MADLGQQQASPPTAPPPTKRKGVPVAKPTNLAPQSTREGGGTAAGALGEHQHNELPYGDEEEYDAEGDTERERDDALEGAVNRAATSAGRFSAFGDETSAHLGYPRSDEGDGYDGGEVAAADDAFGDRMGGPSLLAGLGSDGRLLAGGGGSIGATAAPPPSSELGPDGVAAAPPRQVGPASRDAPVCCIVIGMAGSGKTTLMQRINAEAQIAFLPSYIVNLDPAVSHLPYGPNIDIRDTVNYKEVMKQYGLGPNGGIVTALNLFATRFDQVLTLLEARAPELK